MNLKKLVTLAGLSLAAIAFAVPASASSNPVFTHEGTPITGSDTKTVAFKGPAAFVVPGTSDGIHCKTITASLVLKSGSTGTVESFETNITNETQCTTTPNNFTAHTVANDLPWVVHAKTDENGNATDVLTITDVDVTNDVTHPLTQCVIAVRRLTGDFNATIAEGQTGNIKTLTLSGEGKFHAGETELDAVISGILHKEGDTEVGIQ